MDPLYDCSDTVELTPSAYRSLLRDIAGIPTEQSLVTYRKERWEEVCRDLKIQRVAA